MTFQKIIAEISRWEKEVGSSFRVYRRTKVARNSSIL